MKATPGNGNVPELAGSRDAESTDTGNSATKMKPDVDLASWAAMGGNIKPSRTDRKPKRGWKQGGAK